MMEMPENEDMPMGGNEPEEAGYAEEAVKNLRELLARGLAEEIFRKICPSAATQGAPEGPPAVAGESREKEME